MSSIVDGFINIDITVTNLEIESALRVSADPGFILNCGALAAEIRSGTKSPTLHFWHLGKLLDVSNESTSLPVNV